MRIRHQSIIVVAIMFASIAVALPTKAEPGRTGALFLRLGMGARAAGMGEAFTAVAEDATSVYWNPAAMAAVLGTDVQLLHNEYLQSVRLEQAALTHETAWGTLGLSFTGMYMDELERRENVASAIPLGTFGAYDMSFAVGFARYITPNVSVGATVKSVFQKIDEVTAIGGAVDAGIYHISRIKGVKFAAVVGNIGTPMKFHSEEFALPRYFKIGGSYEKLYESVQGRMLLTLDVMFPNDDDVRQHIGAEYGYQQRFFLRSGYKAGYDSQGATFGLGVSHREITFNYAYMLVRNDLGDSHRFGLGLSL